MKQMLSIGLCIGLILGPCAPIRATNNEIPASSPIIDAAKMVGDMAVYAAVSGIVIYGGLYLVRKISDYFKRSQWHIYKRGTIQETFDSVAGNDNAKDDLLDIVNFLKDPSAYHVIGAKIPKGVLLVGPPGTGKTLLARALAGEADCNFISVSGSEFVHMFVGAGANNVRSLFTVARSSGPCIIFIDEIDALIKERNNNPFESSEYGHTLNQLLAQMDGFEQYQHPLIVVGATNRLDGADPAALRPGRFDRVVNVGLPTVKDRTAILTLHLQKVAHDADIDLTSIARRTTGFSGAHLANIINEAAIIALNKGRTVVCQADLEAALDKMIMGKPNRNLGLSAEEKCVIAYHEAGHALVHVLLSGDKSVLHKVSIISRGRTGGHTAFLDPEKYTPTKEDYIHFITVTFGGMAAEKVIYNTVTSGPAHDIQVATDLARAMICSLGMSDLVGPVAYRYNSDTLLAPYAQTTLAAIDAEVKTVVENCYQQAMKFLTEHKDKLDKIAAALLEKEELSAEEVYALIH